MHVRIYDSSYYSKENGWGDRCILWGLEAGTSRPVCLNVLGYPVEAHLELPVTATSVPVQWTSGDPHAAALIRRISGILRGAGGDGDVTADLVERRPLIDFRPAPKPYIRVRCNSRTTLDSVIKKSGGDLSRVFDARTPVWHETDIDPTTKMFAQLGWERSGWFALDTRGAVVYEDPPRDPPRETTGIWSGPGSSLLHVYADYSKLERVEDPGSLGLRASPLIMYFDLEVVRADLKGFPSADRPTDIVFMASLVFRRLGAPESESVCIVVGDPDRSRLGGTTVVVVQSEWELYEALSRTVNERDPDVISGYNIHGFDLKYMERRLALRGQSLPNISRLPGKPSEFDALRGPRGARYATIRAPGRIVLDLFLYIVRDSTRQELPSLSLRSVADHYLKPPPGDPRKTIFCARTASMTTAAPGDDGAHYVGKIAPWDTRDPGAPFIGGHIVTDDPTPFVGAPGVVEVTGPTGEVRWARPKEGKIDLPPAEMFRLYLRYALGFPDGPAGLGIVAEYCVRDSAVLHPIFEARGVWETLAQFSNIMGVPMMTVAVAGQVERLTPLIYRAVHRRGIVMETNPEAGTITFGGGSVELSEPGLHENVIGLDFASLYPSIIISNNLCPTTRVREADTEEMAAKGTEGKDYRVFETTCAVTAEAAAPINDDRPVAFESDGPDTGTDSDSDSDTDGGADDPDDFDDDPRDPGTGSPAGTDVDVRRAIRRGKVRAKESVARVPRELKVMYVTPDVHEGVIPEVLRDLMSERARIRKDERPSYLRAAREASCPEERDRYAQMADDANKRQLAMKVCANSVYGFMGSVASYASPAIGMVTTSEGRRTIREVTDYLVCRAPPGGRRHVYTDTDSTQIWDETVEGFPKRSLLDPPNLGLQDLGAPDDLPVWCQYGYERLLGEWRETRGEIERARDAHPIEARAQELCAEANKSGLFRPPMKLASEGLFLRAIWFAPKMYVGRVLEGGVVETKQRGILLRRGDYPVLVKEIYRAPCDALLAGATPLMAARALLTGVERLMIGPPPGFDACRTSTDYKSLAEYKETTCKIAVLALNAQKMGVPLPENSRIDSIMLAPSRNMAAGDSTLLNKKKENSSGRLATREMADILGLPPDRDHYLRALRSHADKLFEAAAPKRTVVHIIPEDAAKALDTPACIQATDEATCPSCGRRMVAWGVARGAGPSGGAPVLCCEKCERAPTGRVSLVALAGAVVRSAAPISGLLDIYKETARRDPNATVESAREDSLAIFASALEALY